MRAACSEGHDADCTRMRGQRTLAIGGEEPFGFEFGLQPEKRLIQPALPGPAHSLHAELQFTTRLVHRHEAANFDPVPFFRRKFGVLRPARNITQRICA